MKTVDWDLLPRWVEAARDEIELRDRLRERGERSVWLSVVSLAVLLGGCAVVWQLAPSSPTSAEATARTAGTSSPPPQRR